MFWLYSIIIINKNLTIFSLRELKWSRGEKFEGPFRLTIGHRCDHFQRWLLETTDSTWRRGKTTCKNVKKMRFRRGPEIEYGRRSDRDERGGGGRRRGMDLMYHEQILSSHKKPLPTNQTHYFFRTLWANLWNVICQKKLGTDGWVFCQPFINKKI